MLILTLALTGLVFSIFFSSSEFALISANKLQIKVWLKQKKRGSGLSHLIITRKEEYLSTILVGTNLSNILATSFGTVYLDNAGLAPIYIVLIITTIILIVGEILPKAITREFSNSTLRLVSPLLYVFGWIFSPFTRLLQKTGWISVAYSEKSVEDSLSQDRNDFQNVYEQMEHSTSLEKDRQEMIANVFDFSESSVQDAMTPRTDISAVELDTPMPEVIHTFIESGHSKLPVYKSDLDHIVGVIHLYDLFKSPKSISEIIQPIHHIPFSKSAAATLAEFQSAHHAVAIVHDEYGGTAGLVTAEDLFEELFGEFEDEFDEKDLMERMGDGSILTDARVDWKVFNERWGDIIPEGNYETVGGYITHKIGRIPNKGEKLYLSIGMVVIRKAGARRIDQVQIYPEKSEKDERN